MFVFASACRCESERGRMVAEGQRISVGDNRWLGYRTYGDSQGYPVVALHGTPGSSLKFAGAHPVAERLGLKLISLDRWGYGASDVPETPSLATFGEDIARFANALGIERLGVLGISGGGPYAVAAAAVMGVRVSGLALAAPVGDVRDRSTYSLIHKLCFGPLTRMPGTVGAAFAVYRWLLRLAPGLALRIAVANGPTADRRIIADPEIRKRLTDAFRFGLKNGIRGPVVDLQIFGQDLGTLPEQISAQTCIWYGCRDGNVPIAGIGRLAERIAGARVVVFPEEGHFWITRDYDDVLGWLAAHGPRRG